jgi:hypothetical protein
MLISGVLAVFFLSYLRFRAPRLRVGLGRRTEAQTQPESSNNIRCPIRPIGSDGQPDSDKIQPDGHTTLKQRSMNFEKYYNLFSQKKNRFKMKDASLIDAMKFNVSYFTQLAVLMYRVSKINQRSITFDEHVTM